MNAVKLPLGSDFRYGSLRSLRETDVFGMLSWMHDPETAELFARDFMSVTESDARSFVVASWNDMANVHLAITDECDAYAGTVSLKDVDACAGTAEFAIAMIVGARGTGAALRGTRELIELAFDGIGLRQVWLCVKASNTRAIKIYADVGFSSQNGYGIDDELRYFVMCRS